jgi:hypothetical protein
MKKNKKRFIVLLCAIALSSSTQFGLFAQTKKETKALIEKYTQYKRIIFRDKPWEFIESELVLKNKIQNNKQKLQGKKSSLKSLRRFIINWENNREVTPKKFKVICLHMYEKHLLIKELSKNKKVNKKQIKKLKREEKIEHELLNSLFHTSIYKHFPEQYPKMLAGGSNLSDSKAIKYFLTASGTGILLLTAAATLIATATVLDSIPYS